MNDIKNKLIGFIKDNYFIIIILLVAFSVRWYGIYFDYPFGVTWIGDERSTMQFLIDATNNKNLFTASSSYPVLMAFFYFPVLIIRIIYLALANNLHSLEEIKGFLIGHGIGQIYIIIRWFSVFIGTASVYLIYKIYSLIFKHKTSAYYAALVYTFSLIPVVLSHWGKLHAPMAFFFLLSLFFILKFEIEKKEKYFFWSTVAAAMSFSSHYIGIMSFVFPFVGLLSNWKEISVKTIIKSLASCIFVFLIAFAVDYKGIYIMFAGQYNLFLKPNNFAGLFPVGKFERFYYGLADVLKIEPVFF
ncbi:MAG: glycosyltransferase family 39 protein, partial [Parcubacteria group bacterium]